MGVPAVLVLEDGTVFEGVSLGAIGTTTGEVVFNTSMTGYQEILTDPSYMHQLITLTYPHIGNYGVNTQDLESETIWASGLIIKDYQELYSNWRSELSLQDFLKKYNCVAIADIDTRRLTRIIRKSGAQNACIHSGGDISINSILKNAQNFQGLDGVDLAQIASSKVAYEWNEGNWNITDNAYKQNTEFHKHVVVYDYGVKRSILRLLTARNCKVTVVPAKTSAEEVLNLKPDGVLLSNGPGDPKACTYAIEAAKTLCANNIPLYGICLGHQILAIACGANTIKMPYGHHGANHPVQDLDSGRVLITSQNHGFSVDEASLPADLKLTHKSLFDNTVQGIEHRNKKIFGFQGHPEASPGPCDVQYLFDKFINMMSA